MENKHSANRSPCQQMMLMQKIDYALENQGALRDMSYFHARWRQKLTQKGQDEVAAAAYWYQTEPYVAFGELMERKERWPR